MNCLQEYMFQMILFPPLNQSVNGHSNYSNQLSILQFSLPQMLLTALTNYLDNSQPNGRYILNSACQGTNIIQQL